MTRFRNNSDRLLEVTLQNEKVLAIAGSMVAYTGTIKFEKSILGGEGIFGALKRKVTNEGMQLMQTSGTGTVFFAQDAAEITVLALAGEKMIIESSSLLAYDTSLKTGTSFAGLRGRRFGPGLVQHHGRGAGQHRRHLARQPDHAGSDTCPTPCASIQTPSSATRAISPRNSCST